MSGNNSRVGFDTFIVVDWSASATPSPKKPSRDAIWVGEGNSTVIQPPEYFRTRSSAVHHLRTRLLDLIGRGQRVLIGWDFAFGYPVGFSQALGLPRGEAPWWQVWKLIDELVEGAANNANNRFLVGAYLNDRLTGGEGPFWGVLGNNPLGGQLRARKDFSYPVDCQGIKLGEWRLVETLSPKTQSVWKLAYAGSVGSQSLLGIPVLYDLVRDPLLSAVSKVWPFQTGFTQQFPESGPLILHAEIYPSHIPLPKEDAIPDREQVKCYVKWLQEQQRHKQLRGWLAGPARLTREQRRSAVEHEGWVLGIE